MSVIVKGMEMPANCGLCYFCDDEARFCKAVKEFIPMVGKPWFCPLVELPEKHGRLIDRDVFETYVQEKWERNEISNGDWIMFREWLRDQETIVEAEGE